METLAALLVFAGLLSAPVPPALTPQNWEEHPRIREVRAVYDEVQAFLKTDEPRWEKREDGMDEMAIALDARGVPRRLRIVWERDEAGGKAANTAEYSYDGKGELRFIFFTSPSCGVVMRQYVAGGRVFWEIRDRENTENAVRRIFVTDTESRRPAVADEREAFRWTPPVVAHPLAFLASAFTSQAHPICFSEGTPGATGALEILLPNQLPRQDGDGTPVPWDGAFFALTRAGDAVVLNTVRITRHSLGISTHARADRAGEHILFIRGFPKWSDGQPVPTSQPQRATRKKLPVGDLETVDRFRVGTGNYVLSYRAHYPDPSYLEQGGPPEKGTSQWTLSKGRVTQVLNNAGCLPPTVLWAGDLDGDGALDLATHTKSCGMGYHGVQLWLSSGTKRGELVGLAASTSWYEGC